MGKTVVFLGAGSSKALGLPLTQDILPMLVDRLTKPADAGEPPLFGGDEEDRKRLRRCLETILPGLDEFIRGTSDPRVRRDALPMITDVLSALDYFLLSANAPSPDFSIPDLVRARSLVERAIFELVVRIQSSDTIDMSGVPDAVNREWQHTAKLRPFQARAPDTGTDVHRTAEWILGLPHEGEDRVTLISTNYDIEIEQELYNRIGYEDVFRRVDFGMSVQDPVTGAVFGRPEKPRVAMYKLHGSLNWLRCDVCDNLYVNPVGAIAYLSFLLGDDSERRRRGNPWLERLWKDGANECHCGYRPLRHMIVAPSFVRNVRDPILLEIWRNALEALRRADRWIIVGYSLPPEDVAIRSMLLRAFRARDAQAAPAVVVVQLRKKEPEASRYQLLFPRHEYVDGGLSSYIESAKLPR